LAADATRLGPLLGEAGAVAEEGVVGVPDLCGDGTLQLGEHGAVVPVGGADEQL
jgi:hypothetical protein